MFTSRRSAMLVSALVLAALFVPSAAFGQATRTWVSGTGDDANPCSRTAPCKTFAGAISKTAAKGEINVIDSGGFGALTINKAITVKAEGLTAGVLTNVNNAINIQAGVNDKVKLMGLDINGLGAAANGIRITQAKSVIIKNNDIFEFARNAISVEPGNPNLRVIVSGNQIHDNVGVGVMNAPRALASTSRVTVSNNDIEDNGCGIVATEFGVDPAFNFSSNCGTAPSTSGIAERAQTFAFHNGINNNVGVGVFSRGNNSGLQAQVRIGSNDITGNATGLQSLESGAVISFGNNNIDGNTATNPPTATVLPSKRLPKRAGR
jgi:hypothetical protein